MKKTRIYKTVFVLFLCISLNSNNSYSQNSNEFFYLGGGGEFTLNWLNVFNAGSNTIASQSLKRLPAAGGGGVIKLKKSLGKHISVDIGVKLMHRGVSFRVESNDQDLPLPESEGHPVFVLPLEIEGRYPLEANNHFTYFVGISPAIYKKRVRDPDPQAKGRLGSIYNKHNYSFKRSYNLGIQGGVGFNITNKKSNVWSIRTTINKGLLTEMYGTFSYGTKYKKVKNTYQYNGSYVSLGVAYLFKLK